MANRRITQRLINALKSGKSVHEIRDTELRGFGLRILLSGRKRYFMHAQSGGQRRWTTIGDADTMPLADARSLARSRLAEIVKGGSSLSGHASPDSLFEDIADAAFRRHSRTWKPGTLKVNRKYLKNQILPRFCGRRIGAITNGEVRQWFASLRSTPSAADRSMPILFAIMREAETLGHRPEGSNPCVNIRRYWRRGREQFLSREETRRRAGRSRGMKARPWPPQSGCCFWPPLRRLR